MAFFSFDVANIVHVEDRSFRFSILLGTSSIAFFSWSYFLITSFVINLAHAQILRNLGPYNDDLTL